MEPSIGRIIHYTSRVEPRHIIAGLITSVFEDGWVSLTLFPSTRWPIESTHLHHVEFSNQAAGCDGAVGKWSWPAHV